MEVLTDDQVRRTRAAANGLDRPFTGAGPDAVTDVVRRVAGVQAQTWTAAALAVRARSSATVWSDVDQARVADRSVVRGWYQRGTLHLVAVDDLPWLLVALRPAVDALLRRQRFAELGLDGETRAAGRKRLLFELSRRGPLTRAEIGTSLAAAGLLAASTGQAVIHLIRDAALHQEVCYGPDRDGKETWVAAADWLGPVGTTGRETALAELAGRYLAAYGPATAEDLAAWSGLPKPEAREAFTLRRDLVEVSTPGGPMAMLAGQETEVRPGEPRLIGEYDTYLLGHAGRGPVLDERFRRRIHPGGGLLRPAVVGPDGRVAGGWRFDRRRGAVDLEPFTGGAFTGGALDAEVADVTRFCEL